MKKKAKDLHTSLDLRIQRVDVQEKNLNLAKLERLRFARERAQLVEEAKLKNIKLPLLPTHQLDFSSL